jgi:hypothetical protein
LTSPAEEILEPLKSKAFTPLIEKPCAEFFTDTVIDFSVLTTQVDLMWYLARLTQLPLIYQA